jgi:hypothetical protein
MVNMLGRFITASLVSSVEVSAFGQLVVVNQVWIRLLRPTLRGWIELVREDAHGKRDADAFDAEE